MPKRPRESKQDAAAGGKVDYFAQIAEARAKAARGSMDGPDAEAEASAASAASAAAGATARPHSVYDKEAVLRVLASIEPEPPLPWIERLDVASAAPLDVPDVDDDLEREKQFYKQAFAAVITARAELERQGVPHLRPDDYFAEMLKSDAHMVRVRGKLLAEKERLEAVEARKRSQESRKFAKQVQAEKAKERAAEKKATEESVTEWRRQRARAGGSGAVDAGKGLERVLAATGRAAIAEARGQRPGAAGGPKRGPSRKRQHKDSKFGFGGRKRTAKENDSKSAKDTSAFSARRNRELPAGMSMRKGGKPGGGKAGGKNKGASRPGKASRTRARSSR